MNNTWKVQEVINNMRNFIFTYLNIVLLVQIVFIQMSLNHYYYTQNQLILLQK